MLLIPHLNRELIGDKIVLSALIEAAKRRRPEVGVWGIEGDEAMRMRFYGRPPVRVLHGDVIAVLRETVARFEKRKRPYEVELYRDANSVQTSVLEVLEHIRTFDLWDSLAQAKKEGIVPRLATRKSWVRQASVRLGRRLGSVPERFVAIHYRRLERQTWKNSDPKLIAALGAMLHCDLGIPVVVFGRGDARQLLGVPGVVDLGGEEMPLEETAGMLSLASVHVGGDSGPTHLAGAVGCAVVGIGYLTERFGPFVPAAQLLGLYGEAARGSIRKADVANIAERIAEFLISQASEGRRRREAHGILG